MNIGILTICTGKYDIFFEELYNSLEKNFLVNHDKKYYVFSDGSIPEHYNVIKINQKKLGWPYDTMMRFHMFNSISDKLNNEDYLFFFNANMKAINKIGDEIIPKKENNWLMGAHHPGFLGKKNTTFPYERNINSKFYIPKGRGKYYIQGCFNGGRTKEWLKMSKLLADNIDIDIKNDIIPIWHDESAINWFYNDKKPLIMPHTYIYPEKFNNDNNLNIKMIQLDKNKYGTHKYLRN